ncbi:ATP-grasp domain-containing protein [Desulfospira joergensenii]|uniref:ATP-grasp domain-containing protein n=1 Tax=Desulfospira joergensenii TaxID=53329 RepID=UPI0003B4AE8B|nr:ATP-grasp domain-containing protein [Desulfospira joergensenii]
MKNKPCVHDKVLVVGTTADYIHWIQSSSPGRALFLTEPDIRKNAGEPCPGPEDELVISFDNGERVRRELKKHLQKWDQRITGVACFDCESMETASLLAADLCIDYPDIQSIKNCRDKHETKKIWQKNDVPCPKSMPIRTVDEAVEFLTKCKTGIVLKPFCGSGSELVYRCKTDHDCRHAFTTIKDGLKKRRKNRLFKREASGQHIMLAEEYIAGPEYSCDFIIEDEKIRIIRMSRKIKSPDPPFGTVTGYILPAGLPRHIQPDELEIILLKAARSLGIHRALCMVDFIIGENSPMLIEMTPRPGGDCLPFLLKTAGNLDILGLSLDFAEHKPLPVNGSLAFTPHIGLRIHARKPGRFNGFNADALAMDERVKSIHFIRKPGHMIALPPEDYDSWLLGHIIIEPYNNSYPETESLLIRKRLQVEIEQ